MLSSLTLLCAVLLPLSGCAMVPTNPDVAPEKTAAETEAEAAANSARVRAAIASGTVPYTVVKREQLEASGYKSVGELIRATPFTPSPALDETVLWMNAPGGEYHHYRTDTLNTPLAVTAELTIERVNKHEKWGPRMGLCVDSSSSDHKACIYVDQRVDRHDTAGTKLKVNMDLYKGKTLVSSLAMPGKFEVGNTIKIGLRSRTDGIEFKVGEGPWQMQALPFSPKPIEVLCSSAVCKLRIRPATGAEAAAVD